MKRFFTNYSFSSRIRRLEKLANLPDSARRQVAIDQYWHQLVSHGHVPLIEGNSVVFLYRGPADSVSWQGDFNGWGRDKKTSTRGRRLGQTDIWYWKTTFPTDARLDYKIVLNGQDWILDPANPLQQWGGGGPNSVLPMRGWQPDKVTFVKRHVRPGSLSDNFSLASQALGYEVNYRVYLPAGYESLRNLPVIYVTDGQEYADEKMGAMPIVLDNLIAARKIKPVIAVFLDPREPGNPFNNRRMNELALNPQYVHFVTQELIPAIDTNYRTRPSADARAMLGTSLGGLNAAYFGVEASAYIQCIGIHSPAFWYRPAIYHRYEEGPRLPLKIYMSTGVIHDAEEGARRMKDILQARGYPLYYQEVNQGHSWGNWRNLIDEVLVHFFKR